MINEPQEEHDPLSETEQEIYAELHAGEEAVQPEIPVTVPVVEKPFYTPFTEVVDLTNISDKDLTHVVPTKRINDKSLDELITLCQKLIDESKDDKAMSDGIKNFGKVLYHMANILQDDDFISFFDNPNSDLAQAVKGLKGGVSKIAKQTIKLDDSVTELNGSTALRYLNKVTNIGSPTKIPLWHSGLIVTIDSATEAEMLELNIALSSNQIELGTNTRGAVFSGDDVHTVCVIIDFILTHITDCNMKTWTRTNLNKLILVKDIPSLMAGMLVAIYPSGYPVFHPCVNTAKKLCNFNITPRRKENNDYYPDSLLDFTKVIWVDQSKLTPAANLFMTLPNKPHTYEEVVAYQESLTTNLLGSITPSVLYSRPEAGGVLNISAVFKTPTLMEYSTQCHKWVSDIKNMVEKAVLADNNKLSDKAKEARRKELLDSMAGVTNLVKHASWIETLIIDEPDGVQRTISSEGNVISALESLVKLDKFTETTEKAIQGYKENTIVCWSGIPNFKCPVCGTSQIEPGSATSLIPINMAAYFFTTMEWRHQMRH